MDNLGRITGGASLHGGTSAGKYMSVSSKKSINTKDSFTPSKAKAADPLLKADAVKKVKGQAKGKIEKTDLAHLFRTGEDGKIMRTSKVSCGKKDAIKTFEDKNGEKHVMFPSSNSKSLMVLKEDGTPELQIKMPGDEEVVQVEYSSANDRIYVRTPRGFHAYDPSTGKVKGTQDFGRNNYSNLFLLDDKGKILFSSDKELMVFDKDLKKESSETIGFIPDEMVYLSKGSLMLFEDTNDACLQLRDAKGKIVLDERHLGLHSVVRDGDTIYGVNEKHTRSGKRNGKEVIRYNEATGKVSRFSVSKEANSVIPLKNGGFIVFEDELSHPKLIGCDKDGDALWNMEFPKEGFLRQTFLSEDEKQLFLVHTSDDEHDKNRSNGSLYRVNLDGSGSLMGKAKNMLFSTGKALEPKMLHTAEGDNRAMLPMVLDDNRIVVFEKKEIRLLDPRGKEVKTFKNIDELKKAIPESTKVISRRVYTDYTAEDPMKADRNEVMKTAVNMFHRDDAARYSTTFPSPKGVGYDFSPEDSTVGFTTEVDEKNLLDAAGLKDKSELEALRGENNLLNFAFSKSINVPIKNSGVERVEVEKDKITVKYDPYFRGYDDVHSISNAMFTTLLPVKMGSTNLLFAGTSDGMLRCYDLDNQKERQAYSLGSSPKSIRVLDGDKIVTVTKSGDVFAFKPLLKKGETIEGKIRFTGMNTGIETGDAASKDDKVVIDKDTRVVNIGGVQLPIHGNKDFYIRG